jgi:hypothetical protein
MKKRSEEPGVGVGSVEDAVGDGVVGGLRQVDAVPVRVRRRVRAHAGSAYAAARYGVEVVWPAAATARLQRPFSETCSVLLFSALRSSEQQCLMGRTTTS